MLRKITTILVVMVGGSLVAAAAQAQVTADAVQTLDRVTVFGATSAVEMGFSDISVRNPDFTTLNATASSQFTSCQVSTAAGLYCLDGKNVRNWPDPKKTPSTSSVPVSCADTALGLDTKRSDTCTAITVDLAGNIWLAGRKANAYSLFKIRAKVGGVCPDPTYFKPLAGTTTESTQPTGYANYCYYEMASGRPLLLDISVIDGAEGKLFDYGPGVVGLEQRQTVMFYQDVLPKTLPIELGAGKTTWALQNKENITGATILQRASTNFTDNFAVVTTDKGRVLAKDVAANSVVFDTLYNIPAKRAAGSATCGDGVAGFETRASIKSGRVYVTDRAVCQVNALVPNWLYTQSTTAPPAPAFTLVNALGPKSSTDSTPVIQTLSTSYAGTTVAPDGISIAPGISIDLTKCSGSCVLIPDSTDSNPYAGASLSGVSVSGPTGATVFQIRNIPDCRYASPLPTICSSPNVIVTDTSGRQYLNVSPLMPDEILKLFPNGFGNGPGQLPPLLISPDNVGTTAHARNYRFDAFFVITDPAIQFRNTFTLQFDITQLFNQPNSPSACGTDTTIQPNLDWDLVTTASEFYSTVGGPTGTVTGPGREHVDAITNTDCFNPTSGTRWSIYTYGLQPKPGPIPARTYLDMVVKLYNDLYATQTQLACTAVNDGSLESATLPPLGATDCSTLTADWNNGLDKLNKCIQASTSPKTSAGSQNCTAFQSQLSGYLSDATAAVRLGPDRANRIGELIARSKVLQHVFAVHFLPSIPDGGFPPP